MTGDFTVTKTIGGKQVSVYYDKFGNPDFSAHIPDKKLFSYSNPNLTGANSDILKAQVEIKKRLAGHQNITIVTDGNKLFINGVQHTWHHLPNGRDIIPVPTNIHNKAQQGFNHSGGASLIENGLQDLFN